MNTIEVTLGIRRGLLGRLMALSALLLLCASAQAQLSPGNVPGKEYSDRFDKNELFAADPEQTLLWDGHGNVRNGYRYGTTGEVNGMANVYDMYFPEVIRNSATLLFSTTGDAPAPILYLTPKGQHGIWATAPEINLMGVDELDGLEVWGPSQIPDANRYSLEGDPDGIAVFAESPFRSPVFTVAELAESIGLNRALWGEFDLDGLMTYGDSEILFSIAPIGSPTNVVFDGGEIWHWTRGAAQADYLTLGGYTFNTELDIMGTFGTRSENIDALEAVAVPEPSTYGLSAALALIILGVRRWHGGRRAKT